MFPSFFYFLKNKIKIKISSQFSNSELLPDAIQTDCSKCTTEQKQNSKKIINFLRTRRPSDWNALLKKYDPESKFQKRLNGLN